jgi:hypothetical protein
MKSQKLSTNPFKFSGRPSPKLIPHTKAAGLMSVPEYRLRARNEKGSWKNYPELGRWQEAPGTTIWLSEEQVEKWVANRNKVFEEAEKQAFQFPAVEIAQEYRRRGWDKAAATLERFGLA